MTRDAKLFLLNDKDYQPLIDLISSHPNISLKHDLTIFRFPHSKSKSQNFSILSLSQELDKILEEYGAVEASQDDLLRNTLHDITDDPLYGDKQNIIFLNKIR